MKKIILFTASALFFFFVASNSYSQKKEKLYPNVTRYDFTRTMSDGAVLDCSRFVPDGSPPSGGWPAIIFCHGYGGTKEDCAEQAEDMAGFGYYCFIYTMRGQGFSTGKSNLISTTEMNDFIQILNYVKSLGQVKASRVGATGGSQGGIIPFMAACNGAALRMVASEVCSPEFATDWITNKSVKMTLLWTLSYDTSIARYNNQVKSYRDWILSDTPAKWDSIAYYMPLNRDFSNKVSQNTTAIHIANVWQDKFFNSHGVIKQLNNFLSPSQFYFGTFDAHGAENDDEESQYYADFLSYWMDYWLADDLNGIMDSAKYVYAASSYPRTTNKWTWTRYYSGTWPPAGVENVKFYLQPNLKLKTVANTYPMDTLGFINDIKDLSLTMTEAVNREFTGTVFNTKFGKTSLVFETPPLVQDSRMVGAPLVNVHYKCDANKSQFNFQIWDVQPNNTANIVNRANATERNIAPNVIRQLTFDGTSHAHTFKAGNRIRVILTNLDNITNDPFLRTNPYVLPSLVKARNTIFMNAANPTYIQLPLIGYIPNNVFSNTTVIPDNYFLGQNYPNPFNPTTRIKFGIPKSESGSHPDFIGTGKSAVKLIVYNILGREVATLVNENLSAGEHEVIWNAVNLPSGVYFSRLVAGNYVESKKMILLK